METKFTTPVLSVEPESSIFDALRQMQTNFVKHIVVITNNKPVGVVTERDINKFLQNDKTSRALNEIPIKHVMHKNVISISDGYEDHFNQCATRMETFKIGSIVLVDDKGILIGIVTKTDLVKAFSMVYGGKFKVKDFMSKRVITCRKSDSLQFALDMMNRNEISRLVVTDENGIPEGLISTNTFLNHSDYFSKGETRSRDYLLPLNKGKKLSASDLMADEVLTINEDEDLATAGSLMVKNKIGGIPVIDLEKNLVGVISKFDVVKAFVIAGTNENLKSKYREFY